MKFRVVHVALSLFTSTAFLTPAMADGGDESKVDYVLDSGRKLVSGYWHNQSPERFWFCE